MNPILLSKITGAKHTVANRFLVFGFAILATGAFALSSTSCATSKGFGRDVQKVGDKIEDAADRTGGAR